MVEEIEDKPEEHLGAGNLMDSRISHLDDELSARLEEAFHQTTFQFHLHDVAKIANEYNPIDLAYAAQRLPHNARSVLYENLPDLEAQVTFMINTNANTRRAVFHDLEDEEITYLIDKMPSDEAIWVLDDLPDRRLRRILDTIELKKRQRIKDLQKHSRKSAGGLMTNEFFAFPGETTISQASAQIRENPGIDLTRRIFVIDAKGELQGYVPARNLIVNPPNLPLKQVMRQVEHQVSPDATREEAVDVAERYKISALPVVSSENVLVGVLTYEDILEVIEDIADETIARIAGTAEEVGEHEPVFKRFYARAPWLLVTLCAGLISASVISYFQLLNAELLALIFFFIPLINGMSGNVGVQCSTVLVRGMAIGAISSGQRREAATKELSIGLLTGVIFGCLCGVIVYLLSTNGIGDFSGGPFQLGITVAAGILGASLTATTLGVSAPFFFARIGVDPALASGPIVTAFNDVVSMIMFFLISGFLNSIFFN